MSRPPHILHVFPAFVPGGSQVRTCALMAGLAGQFRHSVMSMNGATSATDMLPEGFEVGLVDAPPKASFFATLKHLRTIIESVKPDLVATYNWGAIESAMAARSLGSPPVVHHEDGFGPDEAAQLKRRRTWTRRLVLKNAAAVVVVSRNLGTIATKKWRIPSWTLREIPNGVELERFEEQRNQAAAAALRDELGIPPGAFVVGSVGHLRPEKNYPRLVEALSIAHKQSDQDSIDWRLLIVGDGAERGKIEACAAQLGLTDKLHFAGHRADCAPALGAMDIFSLSSDTEQMPISLVEAMASRRPAVCTDVGDIALMVPPESAAHVVPLTNAAANLAAAFQTLSRDANLRSAIAQAGYEKAHKLYSQAAMLDTYKDVYLRAIAGEVANPA